MTMKTIVNLRARARGQENPRINLLSRAVLWGDGRFKSNGRFKSDTAILVYLALAKLLIHLLTANNYGYFGDEFYWLAMAKHLDFGYVDVPPLVAYLGALWRALFGASLFAIHILPGLAGAVMVFFVGLLARELGGGRFAQGFTALMVLAAPIWLALNSWFAYDPFDQLGTVILLYLIARLIKQETPRRWLGLGIMAGLGIMTKLTMIFTTSALILGLLASPRRKSFLTKWPWLAAGIAILMCAPYALWQWVHGWPLITYWQNYAMERFHPGPLVIFLEIFAFLNPAAFPVWFLGLGYLLFHRDGKKYRPFGLSFLVLLVFFVGIMKLEARLLVSALFPLLAGGAVWLERFTMRTRDGWGTPFKRFLWFKRVYIGVIVICGLLLAPFFLPVLPIGAFEKYQARAPRWIRADPNYPGNRIPFPFAYRFGWPELVQQVAKVYQGLPEADRDKCVIWANNYAEAGAIDLLGKSYGLPPAISTHLSYQIWGLKLLHTGKEPEVVILITPLSPYLAFQEATAADFIQGSPYGVSWESYRRIYVCRKPYTPLREFWRENPAFR